MKKMLFVCVLAACGGGQKSSARDPWSVGVQNSSAEEPGPSVPAEEPSGDSRIECAPELLGLLCEKGVDGCLSGKTTVHVCIPEDAVEDRSCALEFVKICPEGQIDACLQKPPSAKNHVCVYK